MLPSRSDVLRFVLLTMLCMTSCASTQKAQPPPPPEPKITTITKERFAISGVTIGSLPGNVRHALGQPASIQRNDDGETETWFYDGLVLLLVQGEVRRVECTSANYATQDGIHVGDSSEQVRTVYGTGDTSQGNQLRFPVENCMCQLIFELDGDTVKKVTLFFDWT